MTAVRYLCVYVCDMIGYACIDSERAERERESVCVCVCVCECVCVSVIGCACIEASLSHTAYVTLGRRAQTCLTITTPRQASRCGRCPWGC